jgi:uncharacterized protein affecting Mg2+/Co2+ transport
VIAVTDRSMAFFQLLRRAWVRTKLAGKLQLVSGSVISPT